MDDNEKFRRCIKAPLTQGTGTLHCIVYGRTVRSCEDCAFSTRERPLYLRKMGITEYNRISGETRFTFWRT